MLWISICASSCIGGSRGGAKGAEFPLHFFRYVFLSMVPDTETSIGVIFCINKYVSVCIKYLHYIYVIQTART